MESVNKSIQIILCRHGETEWSLSGKHTSLTDIPLTKKGEEQAKGLSQRLRHFSYEVVYSSPLQRASKTCALANLSKPMILEPNAVEWNYGDYEGLTTPEIWKTKPKWNLFSDGAPQGENAAEVGKRADLLIQKWMAEQKTVVLFSHAHFLRVLAARWVGLAPSEARIFGLSVASISVLGFERSQKIIQTWNNTNPNK